MEIAGFVRADSQAGLGVEGITGFSITLLETGAQSSTYDFDFSSDTFEYTPADGFILDWDYDLSTGDGDGAFSYTFDTVDRAGDLIIQISATNINGQQTVITRTLRDDNQGPDISITSPNDYSTVRFLRICNRSCSK